MRYQTISRRVVRQGEGERKRASTLRHVRQGWVPFRPDLAAQRHERFQSGVYESAPELLGEDLAEDIGFFAWSATFLKNAVSSPFSHEARRFNPLVDCRALEPTQLQRMLQVRSDQITSHRYARLNRCQQLFAEKAEAARSMSSAIFADTRCADALDRHEVLATVLFEELGWHLLAWNYPTVLHSIVRRKRSGPQLAQELRSMFGCTPAQLGRELAQEWGVAESITDTLAENPPVRPCTLAEQERKDRLRTATELISTFSSGSCRELASGSSERDVERLMDQLEISSPKSMLDEARSRFADARERLTDTVHALKSMRRAPALTGPSRTISKAAMPPRVPDRTSRESSGNDALSARLNELREALREGTSIHDILRQLFEQAAPVAGFTDGCVLLASPDGRRLVPTLSFARNGSDRATMFSRALASVDPASDTWLPMKEQFVADDGTMHETITGAFRTPQNYGVLWLEVEEDRMQQDDYNGVTCFKLFRQCLEECLSAAA